MNKVLIVNASARKERSMSRHLTHLFVEKWKLKNADDHIIYREIGQSEIPHITEEWIGSAFKPAHLRTETEIENLKLSDSLIQELKDADVIVLGTPMYNWSIPSKLKAYIDQILRVNETILINPTDPENHYVGLLKDKKAYLLLVRGNAGYEKGEFFEHMNFQSNYLKTVLGIMGIHDVEEVALNGSAHGEEVLNIALKAADEKIGVLLNS